MQAVSCRNIPAIGTDSSIWRNFYLLTGELKKIVILVCEHFVFRRKRDIGKKSLSNTKKATCSSIKETSMWFNEKAISHNFYVILMNFLQFEGK